MKKWIALLLTVLLVMTLASPAALADDYHKGELTLWLISALTGDTCKIWDMIDAYEAQYPDVKITIESVASADLLEKFETAVLAGGGPDIINLDNSGHSIDAAAMGTIIPYSQVTSNEWLEETYLEGPLNSGRFYGEYYAIPWFINSCGIYYNKDILDASGVEKVPETWAEFEDAIAKVTAAGYDGIVSYLSSYFIYNFFYTNNCWVVDTNGETPVCTLDTPEAKEAWDFLCKLVTEYKAFPEAIKECTSWDQTYNAFVQGNVAFMFCGDWASGTIRNLNPDLNFDSAGMCEGKIKATALGGWTLDISANCKNPELAFDFIKYLTSAEGDELLANLGRVSGRKDGDAAYYLANFPEKQAIDSQGQWTYNRPAIVNEKAIDTIMTNEFLSVIYGEKDAATSLADMYTKVAENIASNYS